MKARNFFFLALTAGLSAAGPLNDAKEPLERRQFGLPKTGGGRGGMGGLFGGSTGGSSGGGIMDTMTSYLSSFMGGGTTALGSLSSIGSGLMAGTGGVASMFMVAINYPYGKSPQIGGGLPTRVEGKPDYPQIPNSRTVRIRYGPYRVPNRKIVTRALTGAEEGMLWNYPDMNVQKPCDDCMLFGIVAEYEYLNGTKANIDTGQWLHHMVMFTGSSGRTDPTCASNPMSLPHQAVGLTPSGSERFWASGNERTPLSFPKWGINNVGYYLKRADTLSMIIDLMNMANTDQTMYVVIKYDYVPGKPSGWSDLKPIWLDVDQCAFSEAKARSQNGAFSISSSPWRSSVNGEIIGMAGHLHDGGLNVQIKADGRLVCDSIAKYGEKPEYVSGGMPGMDHHGGMQHVSSMSECVKGKPELKTPTMRSGQSWTLTVNYDYRKFAGMTHGNGQQENVMGIAVIYVKK